MFFEEEEGLENAEICMGIAVKGDVGLVLIKTEFFLDFVSGRAVFGDVLISQLDIEMKFQCV